MPSEVRPGLFSRTHASTRNRPLCASQGVPRRQGYSVKGEVSDCDVVAVRGDEEPVVVERKTAFTLQHVFQDERRSL